MVTKHLIIHGRVHGVAYRDSMLLLAMELGVKGWVRNRRDGTVEALVSGAPDAVDDLIAACWRGPPAARVADIQIETSPTEADLFEAGFAIRPSV